MTVQNALRQATGLLEQGAVAAARLTAEVLLCHALGRERAWLYAHPEEELSDLVWLHFGRYLQERLGGKPTQYITRRQEFYGREFRVSPGVLIPRPETEHVVECALSLAGGARRVVDVGCGSGAIAVTLALELGIEVWGTDISLAALAVAGENARRLGAGVRLVACDLLAAFAPHSFDLVACNPPYVPSGDRHGLQREVRDWEPAVALYAGPTGLEIYQRLVEQARGALRPGGWMVLELGFRALDPVREMLAAGWESVLVRDDLAGIPRVIAARLAG